MKWYEVLGVTPSDPYPMVRSAYIRSARAYSSVGNSYRLDQLSLAYHEYTLSQW